MKPDRLDSELARKPSAYRATYTATEPPRWNDFHLDGARRGRVEVRTGKVLGEAGRPTAAGQEDGLTAAHSPPGPTAAPLP